jgi:serine/threonine protein kinase
VISLLLHIDIEFRVKAGLPALLAEHYFEHPRVQRDDAYLNSEQQVELIYWEYQQRWKNGERMRRADYEVAFPQHAGVLRELKPRSRCPRCDKILVLEETLQTLLCPDCGCESSLLATAPPFVAGTAQPDAAPPRLDLRSYELSETLGEGGMGEVYRCTDPALGRDLAIKAMKAELHGLPKVEQRFLREARITGSLQHPGIVAVHNLGRLADGRLHYTMRLVRGQTFAAILKEEAGKPERLPYLLTIFEKICQAMAYAHSKRVIHRDLKPLNVMVGRFGEVQVMDWGLAKLLTPEDERGAMEGAPDSEGTRIHTEAEDTPLELTRMGREMGTLAYMPMEQALGEWDIVDEKADVFALGSILCEMLTGHPAYHGEDSEEVYRRVKRGDVAEALARLQQCGADAALTTLCLECLSPNREDRPRDAAAVAKRVAEYQTEVQERLRQAEVERAQAEVRVREERKRRRLAVRLAIVVLTLAAGLTVVAGLLSAAWKNEREAKNSSDKERERAVAARSRTREALDAMTSEVIDDLLARQLILTDQQRDFLRKALRYYEEFATDTGQDEDSRAGVAAAHYRAGKILQKLQENKEAEAAYRLSQELSARLTADFPSVPKYRLNLAASLNNLGLLLSNTGRLKEAEGAYDDALAIQKQLVADFPPEPQYREGLAACLHNLGNLLSDNAGKAKQAEAAFREAITFRKQLVAKFPTMHEYRLRLAGDYHEMGILLANIGRTEEAAGAYTEAIALLKPLLAEIPTAPKYRQALARSQHALGIQMRKSGRLKEAEAVYRDALALHKPLVDDFPIVPEYRLELALSYNSLAILLQTASRPKEAETAYYDALTVYKRLVDDFPSIPQYRRELANTQNWLGNLLKDTDRAKEAEAAYHDALSIQKHLASGFPTVTSYRQELSYSYCNLGNLLKRTGRTKEAEAAYRDSLTIQQRLAADFPTVPNYQAELGNTMNGLAAIIRDRKDLSSARQLAEQARSHIREALGADPRSTLYRAVFCDNCQLLAETLLDLFDYVHAAEAAADLARIAGHPANDTYNAACYFSRCVQLAEKDTKLSETGRRDLAKSYGTLALETLRQAIQKGYKDVSHMKKDPDLAPIRGREDFQKLLTELNKAAK